MASKPITLSKSRFVKGIQCEKALYLTVHSPKLATPIDASTQARFDQGREVESHAHKLYPDGVMIDAQYFETEKALEQTEAAIKNGVLTIFEATFLYNGIQVKIDILTRKSAKHAWDIFEVKSSTSVKEQHVTDAAIQLWVARGAGLKISSISILHINNECVYPKLKNLFTAVDITKDVEPILLSLPAQLSQFTTMLGANKEPDIDIGPHCSDPYGCDFQEHCWGLKKIPTPSIFDIPSLGKKAWALYEKGIIALTDIKDEKLNAIQKRMVKHSISKERFVDNKQIAREMKSWKYPLSSLDFETIMYAIPRYEGCKPYEQIPFQFSCHIARSLGAKLEHCEYLHTENTDPREAIAEALVKGVPTEGSVVAYNRGFEGRVLRALANEFPRLKKSLLGIVARLVDPWPIVKANVYDHAFMGSFSLKEVGPAIVGASADYSELPVGDGVAAQIAFAEMIGDDTAPERKEKLKQDLLRYCRQDTLVVVELVKWLEKQIASPQNPR